MCLEHDSKESIAPALTKGESGEKAAKSAFIAFAAAKTGTEREKVITLQCVIGSEKSGIVAVRNQVGNDWCRLEVGKCGGKFPKLVRVACN